MQVQECDQSNKHVLSDSLFSLTPPVFGEINTAANLFTFILPQILIGQLL